MKLSQRMEIQDRLTEGVPIRQTFEELVRVADQKEDYVSSAKALAAGIRYIQYLDAILAYYQKVT